MAVSTAVSMLLAPELQKKGTFNDATNLDLSLVSVAIC